MPAGDAPRNKPSNAKVALVYASAAAIVVVPLLVATVLGFTRHSLLAPLVVLLIAIGVLLVALIILVIAVPGATEGIRIVYDTARRRRQGNL